MRLARVPIESARPVVAFALVRVGIIGVALVAVLVLGFPYGGQLLGVLGLLFLPWALAVLYLSRRRPDLALNPLVAAVDFALLVVLEIVVPEAYGATRFAALFLIAVHAHFQGEVGGVALALLAVAVLVVPTIFREGGVVRGELLAFYESVFAAAGVAAGVLIGRLRTTESASRLRARGVSRRTIRGETEVRRRVAEAIHDGPVQELIALDMVLTAARRASERGDSERAAELIGEAHTVAERNIRVLRDEIVDLGPYAFEELAYESAVERCVELWRRRYGIELRLALEPLELPPEVAGDLFQITQEAVVNAGRHAGAQLVSISLRKVDGSLELRVADDGRGFDVDTVGTDAGHLGLASMRERTELIDGELRIESSSRGTKVVVSAPLGEAGSDRERRPRPTGRGRP